MTALDQTQLEVQCPIHGKPFNAKKPTLIGTWNVRTLNQCGKLAQLLREFDSYRLVILGICEMWWTSSGQIVNDGKPIIYSGHDKEHIVGVGIIMSKIAASALIAWKPISDSIITARLQTNQIKITTIQYYFVSEWSKPLGCQTDELEIETRWRHRRIPNLRELNQNPQSRL
ncbi:craniofacial development protein 2-like [Biomphalaria glabrata]|uniref:Craniofacial development protein 2-like n=1 Tax=Biomphalaria glabrata TaxID=6526 RepID=A0A9W2ZHJ0_BIOGL|nr:craniofacial development protein 2-like [Biomphalaria glabrata]